jgi:hypothetical protein
MLSSLSEKKKKKKKNQCYQASEHQISNISCYLMAINNLSLMFDYLVIIQVYGT